MLRRLRFWIDDLSTREALVFGGKLALGLVAFSAIFKWLFAGALPSGAPVVANGARADAKSSVMASEAAQQGVEGRHSDRLADLFGDKLSEKKQPGSAGNVLELFGNRDEEKKPVRVGEGQADLDNKRELFESRSPDGEKSLEQGRVEHAGDTGGKPKTGIPAMMLFDMTEDGSAAKADQRVKSTPAEASASSGKPTGQSAAQPTGQPARGDSATAPTARERKYIERYDDRDGNPFRDEEFIRHGGGMGMGFGFGGGHRQERPIYRSAPTQPGALREKDAKMPAVDNATAPVSPALPPCNKRAVK